jgi:hypothetical protein
MQNQPMTHDTWCRDFEHALALRRFRVRARQSRNGGYVYTCDRGPGEARSIWVPAAAVRTGGYGCQAALLEIEHAFAPVTTFAERV